MSDEDRQARAQADYVAGLHGSMRDSALGTRFQFEDDEESTLSLSTPISSTQDGPRIMGKGNLSNFGGKKAAPFKKGGGRRAKVLAAKAALAGAKRAKRSADTDNDGD